jgi:hypothetical protein
MRGIADTAFLAGEAFSLLSRLDSQDHFALNTPMVRAAAISDEAQRAITRMLGSTSRRLRREVGQYIAWLRSPESAGAGPVEAQRKYATLKLRFNSLLDKLDIFADVLTQRGEHRTGIWLSGLDVLAADALRLNQAPYSAPYMVCYLERGHGAAIRRARTRLPGGEPNPVAVIQVPRERMIGSGIASSLIHEVGHQGAALLGLVASLRKALQAQQAQAADPRPWKLLERWISEILSDFWAVALVGISATHGLINVVSLPAYFVFRIGTDGPHPFPWIRVKISCAMGRALYPHPQWGDLERQWERFYPPEDLPPPKREIIRLLEEALPAFARLLAGHRPPSLQGRALKSLFPLQERHPAALQAEYIRWQSQPRLMFDASPTLLFAVIGQAKADGRLAPAAESKLLGRMLTKWALGRVR